MQDESLQRVELAAPWRLLDRIHGVSVARFTPLTDPVGAEVYVLGMVLILEGRGKQPNDVHRRRAAITLELCHRSVLCRALRHHCAELGDDVTHSMQLPLARDMS